MLHQYSCCQIEVSQIESLPVNEFSASLSSIEYCIGDKMNSATFVSGSNVNNLIQG